MPRGPGLSLSPSCPPQLSESPASLPPCPPAETALINQRDLTDALLDTERNLRGLTQSSGGVQAPWGQPAQAPSVLFPQTGFSSTGDPLPQASPVSVYLFPGERSGVQPSLPPSGGPASSLGSCSKATDDDKEEEGDGDTLDSDEFCILDAPGLGIPVRGRGAGQHPLVPAKGLRED